MYCPQCNHDNPDGAKFCGECGARLEHRCPSCGKSNSPVNKFCYECGAPLTQQSSAPSLDSNVQKSSDAQLQTLDSRRPTLDSLNPQPLASSTQHPDARPISYTPKHLADKILTTRSALEGERRQVTVLFADTAGFTTLAEQLDPEDVHQILDRCFELITGAVHRFEGTINQYTGDGVMALFGAPIAHEDGPRRAVHSALAIQQALREFSKELEARRGFGLQMRIGLNTGLVVVGKIGDDLRMDYTAVGDTTNVAARMQQLARPDSVVVSEATHKLIEGFFDTLDLGELQPKGHSPVRAFEVLRPRGRRTRLDASVERGLTPLVGRERELTALIALFEQVKAGRGQVALVTGEAGIGKSRLLLELHRALARTEEKVTWLEGRCVSFGQSIPFLPILDQLRENFGVEEFDGEPEIIYERGESWEKALEYLVKAGQKTQRAYANREALTHYNRALAVCGRLGKAAKPATLMTIHAGKGAVLSIMSEFLPSVEAYQRMLEVARQLGDKAKEAEALFRIGDSFFFAHEFEKSLEYVEQAKVLASAIGAKNILASSIFMIGLVHVVTGKLDETARLWEEALRISKEAGGKNLEGFILIMLGQFHNWKGEYEQSLHLHEQARTIVQTHNLQDVLLHVIWTRGVAYGGKGEYERAIVSLQEALGQSERLGDKYFKCRMLNTLGWVYGELYNLELAIRYNQEGAEASYTIGDPEIIRNAEINLGDDYLLLGDIDRAQQYLEKVYRDSQQRGKLGEEAMKWRYLQRCCHSLGELWLIKGDAEKALRFAEECLKLAEPTESRKNIVKGWRLQGQAFCRQGKLAEAEVVLQKALALAQEVGNPPQLWKTYQALGELYEKQGVLEQARSAYVNAIEVIEGVASRLQDQEIKQTFLAARPVQDLRGSLERLMPP